LTSFAVVKHLGLRRNDGKEALSSSMTYPFKAGFMKKRLRTVLISLALFVIALVLLIWFMPAQLALPLMQSRLHGLQFKQVQGTLWQGRAAQLSAPDGSALGSLAWTLSRRALLGDVQFGLDLRQPQMQLQGQMHRVSGTQDDWRDVALHMDMTILGPQPLLHVEPQGQFDLQVPTAQLQGNWPMQIDASGIWSQAAVRTEQGSRIPLGTMLLQIKGEAGVLKATLGDDGSGPLRTAGRLSLSPLGWDLQLDLKPRSENPALLHWLRSLGPSTADGSVQLRYRGGLAHINNTESP
jgi:general secretion pathway protein N